MMQLNLPYTGISSKHTCWHEENMQTANTNQLPGGFKPRLCCGGLKTEPPRSQNSQFFQYGLCQSALEQVTAALLSHWENVCYRVGCRQCEHICSFRICPQIICQPLRLLSGSGWESVTWIIITLLCSESCRWISSGHLPLFCVCR